MLALLVSVSPSMAQAQAPMSSPTPAFPGTDPTAVTGPVRLRTPPPETTVPVVPSPVVRPAPPSEFEAFVKLPRFGANLVNELAANASDYSPLVPPDYITQSGDELQISLWGSVDADLQLTVDRSGRVTIPRVGPVLVAGVRFADLRETIAARVARTFKNFELSVSLGRLRGVRVYVTGFAQRPGAYAVNGLSTVMNAVMRAGGPSPSGSFRQIELRRQGRLVGNFDLYDLLLKGERNDDRLVQPDDVIFVGPIGPQVALLGSVNHAAIFELKRNDTLADLIRMAGGLSAVADRNRVALERLDERNALRVIELPLPAASTTTLANGDVVRVFSAVAAALSTQRQNKRVRVEGEVANPGEYVLPAASSIGDALRASGGLTPAAFIYGAQFTRESVRVTQQENYDRALRDLETESVRQSASRRVSTAEDAATQEAQAAATARLIERLRGLQPSGRIVLQLAPAATTLPDLALEDGDRLYIPPQPSTVGVFGSVFNTGSYLFVPGRTLDNYLRLAGGPTKGADEGSVFVVRANGDVISSRQDRNFFNRGNRIGPLRAEPGDTIFVPEEMDKATFVQHAKDWTQILYQFGLGVAGLKTLSR